MIRSPVALAAEASLAPAPASGSPSDGVGPGLSGADEGGVGVALGVIFLPFADLGDYGWRISFIASAGCPISFMRSERGAITTRIASPSLQIPSPGWFRNSTASA